MSDSPDNQEVKADTLGVARGGLLENQTTKTNVVFSGKLPLWRQK